MSKAAAALLKITQVVHLLFLFRELAVVSSLACNKQQNGELSQYKDGKAQISYQNCHIMSERWCMFIKCIALGDFSL